MKTLVLPNAFKGSLDAYRAGKIIAACFAERGAAQFYPVSDGGDGVIQAFQKIDPKAKIIKVKVADAYGRSHFAPVLILKDKKSCVIESAKICGLGGLKKAELKPLSSTSYGIGQAINAARKKGIKNFYIGLGGVACNDGGAGMARALGVKFKASNRREIKDETRALGALALIDTTALNLKGLKFYALTDVTNPILGPKGSARIFGPQKGAGPAQVKVMDKALTNYVKVIKKDLGLNIAKTPGTGAAGAIAAGLLVFCNAKFINGARFIFDKLNIDKKMQSADFVITTEGALDAQTFMGKIPAHIIQKAKEYNKPVIFICGVNKIKDNAKLKKAGVAQVWELSSIAKSKEDSITNAAKYLKQICTKNLTKH